MTTPSPFEKTNNYTLVAHLSMGDTGTVALIKKDGNTCTVKIVPSAEPSGLEPAKRPIFLGVSSIDRVILLDPVTKHVSLQERLPTDANPLYAYVTGSLHWYVSDGDKETGADELHCGKTGSTVTAVRSTGDSAEIVKTICAGRGHHVIALTAPSATVPAVPDRAFVSNLTDGTISVLGNNPDDASSYLKILDTINLYDKSKEKNATADVPNNAFPHGMVYSPMTGKIYNLNNGYNTIAVIDPINNRIENLLPLPHSSNLLLSPDGRYLIGKGADRASDPEHVIGKLSVVDIISGNIAFKLDIPDLYPSTYRFNAARTKLYVTSAATGKGAQKSNLKKNIVMVFDATALPNLSLIKEVKVGPADCSRRPIAFLDQDGTHLVFVPNPTEGTISVLDGRSDDTVIETVMVSGKPVNEFNFSYLRGAIHGC